MLRSVASPARFGAVLIAVWAIFLAPPRASAGEEKSGQVLFYRILGAETNAPMMPRTRTVCAIDGEVRTSSTGMARSGYTEYPFRKRTISYTFAESYAFFPRIVSGARVDPGRINRGDILVDHVYEPDACVWGPSGREFVQTFRAAREELVSFTLLVATRPGTFRAALLEGGPGGPRVGRIHSFRSGYSTEWGWCRWRAGEAPLVPQRVGTKPGHVYLLSARAHTSVVNGPRGDTRVRLAADPSAGADFGEANGSQWYWTDGRWLRFEYRFRAAAERSTVALGFFRWRDLDRASAYADRITLYDLGPAERALDAAPPPHPDRPLSSFVLADRRPEASDRVEAHLEAPPACVITGLGARAAGDNVTTIRLQIRPVLADGRLGPPEEIVGGWEPDAGLEANIDLPEGFVATGFGARVAPEWDVKTLAVWGRPLGPGGVLGDEKEFRAGVEPGGGLERRVRLPGGRVLTSAGLRCHLNDVQGIRADSARWTRAATGSSEGGR